MKYVILFLLVYTTYAHTCNDCYATSALQLIKHYKNTNYTALDLMKMTSQTCAGGRPEIILKMFFKNVIITTASREKLQHILRNGPAILATDNHAFIAWGISDHGIILQNEIQTINSDTHFKYVCYIKK